jgi:hypothetical protein
MRPPEVITREQFLSDRHGKTFADVPGDPDIPFDAALAFFNDAQRQQRMEDAEVHHDRAPLAGVVRELEAEPEVGRCFATLDRSRGRRLRQATGVLVRVIMERRGWSKTGRKGSLGVPGRSESGTPEHNKGGLSLWFVRAERYQREQGRPFRSVRDLCAELETEDRSEATGNTHP